MNRQDFRRFEKLTFNDFKRMAANPSLNCYEKIGFPTSYRKGKEGQVFSDILGKLTNLRRKRKTIMDIGSGCSGLAFRLIKYCEKQKHHLILIDSSEMLRLLPDKKFITKVAGRYPIECYKMLLQYVGKVDAVLVYSVIQYVFHEGNALDFIEKTLKLLSPCGEMLIGDIPNISKRNRFFKSGQGARFHHRFSKSKMKPPVDSGHHRPNRLNDRFVLSILERCRKKGFDAYVLPQGSELPMANRREDILIKKL